MSQQNIRRFATVGALALLLFMAGAGSAQARDLSLASAPWGWFQELWSRGVSAVESWSGAPAPARTARHRGSLQKQGPGVDPNGSTPPSSLCAGCSDQGYGVDPDGSK